MNGLVIEKKAAKREESPLARITFIVLVILFDIGAAWFIQNALSKGFSQLVVIIGIITVMLNLIFLLPR
ncbi:MAG: hypothetical protein P8183_01970, partial [Anaerolineae bacterium]